MAAGSRKAGVRGRSAVVPAEGAAAQDAAEATAATPVPPAGEAESGRWVERPIEPVVARGRGMHVLGFMPLQGLPMTPLAAKASAAAASAGGGNAKPRAAPDGRAEGRRHHDGYSCQHGNYRGYYGYRRVGTAPDALDPRLTAVTAQLGDRCFAGSEVLDIGCNTGDVSLAVARNLGARRVVGVDIDEGLIESATWELGAGAAVGASAASGGQRRGGEPRCNVEFRAEDFISSPFRRQPSDEPELFDAILCLSVTKWVHFTRGDSGIRKLFRRVLKRLRPGGLFVLEPQEWSSYKKKRHLTPEIRQTVAGIEMKPEAFDDYLIGLGFERVATIAPPSKGPQGFRRSIRLYRKPQVEELPEGEEEAAAEAEECADGKLSKKHKKQKKVEAEDGQEEENLESAAKAKQRHQKNGRAVETEGKDKAEKRRRKAADECAEEVEREDEEAEKEERARRKAEKRRRLAAAGEAAEAEAPEEEEERLARKKAKKQRRADVKDAAVEVNHEDEEEEPAKNGHSKAQKRRKAADEDDGSVPQKVGGEEEEQPSRSSGEVNSIQVAEEEQESNEPVVFLRRRPRVKIDIWS